MIPLMWTKSLISGDKLPFFVIFKKRNKNHLSETKDIIPKMGHAEAASLCTKVVEKYKGDQPLINAKCEKIRQLYFNQYAAWR